MKFTDEERAKLFTDKIEVPYVDPDTYARINGLLNNTSIHIYILRGNRHSPVLNIVPTGLTSIKVVLQDGTILHTSRNEPFLFFIDEGYNPKHDAGVNDRETIGGLHIPDLSHAITEKLPTT